MRSIVAQGVFLRVTRRRFFINTSHLYERLVRTYSAPPPSLSKISTRLDNPTERTSLLDSQALEELADAEADFVAMEVELQKNLIRVRSVSSKRAVPIVL